MREGDLNLNEFLDEIEWGKNKFYENIKIMAREDVYGIEVVKFKKAGEDKEDYFDDDLHFCFRREWKDLAILLFKLYDENPFYRKNRTADNVELNEILEYVEDSIWHVDDIESEYHRKHIMLHPVFHSTFAEVNMLENISSKLSMLLELGSKMPVEVRTGMWIFFNEAIDTALVKGHLAGLSFKEFIDKDKGTLYKNQLFGEVEHTSLDKFIAEMLKKEMDEEFRNEREEISKLHAEAQKELDDIYIKASGDTEEDIQKINQRYDELGIQVMVDETIEKAYENIIQMGLEKAKKYGDFSTSIEDTIDVTINNLERDNPIDKDELIEKLKEIKSIIAKDLEDFKVNDTTEKFLTEINYKILKRRK